MSLNGILNHDKSLYFELYHFRIFFIDIQISVHLLAQITKFCIVCYWYELNLILSYLDTLHNVIVFLNVKNINNLIKKKVLTTDIQ